MGTKEVMVGARFVIVLYDYIFLSGSIRVLIRSRGIVHTALFSCIGILVCLLICSLAKEMNVSTRFVDISPILYLLNECHVIAYYLMLAVWPHPLCLDYSWQASMVVLPLLPWILLVGFLFAGSITASMFKKAGGFIGLSFFAILATTSSVIPVADLAFEHRMYLPLAAVVVLLTLGSYNIAEYLFGENRFVIRCVWLILCCAVLGIFIFLTFQRNKDYRSEESIWRDVVIKRPGNLRARNDLAIALSEGGKFDEALREYERVIASIPHDILERLMGGKIVITDKFVTNSFEYQYFRANVNKATLMLTQKDGAGEAVKLYINALRVAPFNGNVRERLKVILRKFDVPEDRLDYEIQQRLNRYVAI